MNSNRIIFSSSALFPTIFDLDESKGDMRGCDVYDRNDKHIGSISEIYCSAEELSPKYVEIVPVCGTTKKTFVYSYDAIIWRGKGPVYVDTTLNSLKKFKEYDASAVIGRERDNLITYDETLDSWIDEAHWDKKDFSACG